MSSKTNGRHAIKPKRRRTTAADRSQKLSLAKSFVPKMLIESVNHVLELNPRFELHPHSMFFEAIVLLVDISGFTRLSGQYCARGKDGIDDLQKATNGFIGKLVEIIYFYGGDIIKFAGDAIICIFSASEVHYSYYQKMIARDVNMSRSSSFEFGATQDSLAAAALNSELPRSASAQSELPMKALQCALELSRAETEQLTVHVALSAGEICYAIIGGFNDVWECLISGECISDISNCLDDAKSKEVVVTPQFALMLPADSHSDSNSNGSSKNEPNNNRKSSSKFYTSSKINNYNNNSSKTNCSSKSNNSNKLTLVLLPSGNLRATAAKMQQSHDSARQKIMRKFSISRDVLCDSAFILQQIVKFVPYPIIQSMQSDFQHLAEVREVSTMFMKWDSYDNTDHRDLLSLQDMFATAQEILAASGAFVRQFLIDDKGCVLIACWGVPTASYVDNAMRALSAAIKLRNAFSASGFNTSYGITTGNVYCGTIGSFIRREYAAIGDVVNLSARLMSKAAGKIYIDEATFQRLPIKAAQRLTELPPIIVKGKTEPVAIYCYTSSELLISVAEGVSTSDFMIREAHKNQLLGKLSAIGSPATGAAATREDDNLRSSARSARSADSPAGKTSSLGRKFTSSIKTTASIFFIEGKAGTGKASLMRWFAAEVDSRRNTRYSVELTPADHAFEFRAVSRLFHELVGEEILSHVDSERAIVMELLDAIYPVDAKGSLAARRRMLAAMQLVLHVSSNITLKSESSITGSSIFGTIRVGNGIKSFEDTSDIIHLLKLILAELLREESAVIVIENIHLADSNSIRVFETLTRTISQSVILFTAIDVADVPNHIRCLLAPTPKAKGTAAATASGSKFFPEIPTQNETDFAVYEIFRQMLLGHQRTVHIKLSLYTPAEIEAILCTQLQLRSVPRELVKLIHHMSHGATFWVREMIDFVLAAGPDEFLATMNEGGVQLSPPATASTAASSSSLLMQSSSKSDASSSWVPKSLAAIKEENLSLTGSSTGDFSVELQRLEANKLQTFTICRFELLTADEQKVLKIASVFGVVVDYTILCYVLPLRLQDRAISLITSLATANWLTSVSNDPPMFKFMHKLPRRVIYDLIPSSGRIDLHKAITQAILSYYGDSCGDQYLSLATHFCMFDEQKALQYYCLAAQHIIVAESGTNDWIECQGLLSTAASRCKTSEDCELVMKLLARAAGAVYADTFAIRAQAGASAAARALRTATASSNNNSHHHHSKSSFAQLFCEFGSSRVFPFLMSQSNSGDRYRTGEETVVLKGANSVISDSVAAEITGNFKMMERRLEVLRDKLIYKGGDTASFKRTESFKKQQLYTAEASCKSLINSDAAYELNCSSSEQRDGCGSNSNTPTEQAVNPMSMLLAGSSEEGISAIDEWKMLQNHHPRSSTDTTVIH